MIETLRPRKLRHLVREATPLVLVGGMTTAQGLQAIVANCLAHLRGNERGVARGTDPESLHQMRVGLRRVKCALHLFAPEVPVPAALDAEIDWLAGRLAAARDWDVFATETLRQLHRADGGPAGTAPLEQAARQRARQHRRAAARALGTLRYARLMQSLDAWAHGSQAMSPPMLQRPLFESAAQVLPRRRAGLLERSHRLDKARPRRRHRARIAAKKLRYVAEFFEALYPARRMRRFIAELAALQDTLGRLNDADVGARLLLELAETQPGLSGSARRAAKRLSAPSRKDLRALNTRCKRLARVRLPWAQLPSRCAAQSS